MKQHDGDGSPSRGARDSEGLELCLNKKTKTYCGLQRLKHIVGCSTNDVRG